MAIKLPPFPQAPEPPVARFKPDGTPTAIQVEYDAKLKRYLLALAAAAGAS